MRHSSALIATDPRGRFLLQHRTNDAPTWPGYWGLFGGMEEPGENPRGALVRELNEEIQLDVSAAEDMGRLTATGFQLGNFCLSIFYIDLKLDDPSQLRKVMTEGQNLGFYSIEQIRTMLIVPCDLAAIELVLVSLKSRAPSSP